MLAQLGVEQLQDVAVECVWISQCRCCYTLARRRNYAAPALISRRIVKSTQIACTDKTGNVKHDTKQ